jgi:diadenosine tetraphosphate (Ap4A) HIT family hydrolase
MAERCPFCDPDPSRVFYEDDVVIGLWDAYPVSPGHALLVPRRHVAEWFDVTEAEQRALTAALRAAKTEIQKTHTPDGFNIGVNCGKTAGQTVFHLHMHLIPRYRGDSDDPRGGVRFVLPEKAKYWE